MCAQVIHFPQPSTRGRQPSAPAEQTVIDTAFQVHEYVRLATEYAAPVSVGERCRALQNVLHECYGAELSALAEGYFEMIYGCDPYTFLMHVDTCRDT
jgi:hypothetical protein